MIDEKNFFSRPVKNMEVTCDSLRNTASGFENNFTTFRCTLFSKNSTKLYP